MSFLIVMILIFAAALFGAFFALFGLLGGSLAVLVFLILVVAAESA